MTQPSEYSEIVHNIREMLLLLRGHYTFTEIAKIVSENSSHNFYPKDISLLNNRTLKPFKSKGKRPKLIALYQELLHLKTQIKIKESFVVSHQKQAQYLEETTRKAILAELAIYKSVPFTENSHAELVRYFCQKGPAYKKIMKIVHSKLEHHWILNNNENPSEVKIIDVQFVSIHKKQAEVKSKEYWLIKWFDKNAQEYVYEYENQNEQLYLLKKTEGNHWCVHANSYETNKGKILPRKFNPEQYNQEQWSIEKTMAKCKELLMKGELMTALEVFAAYSNQQKAYNIYDELILLLGHYQSVVKQRNLDRLSINEFHRAKKECCRDCLKLLNAHY